MINFKKMDEKDFVFINKSLSVKEEKEFGDFLISRRAKATIISTTKKAKVLKNK